VDIDSNCDPPEERQYLAGINVQRTLQDGDTRAFEFRQSYKNRVFAVDIRAKTPVGGVKTRSFFCGKIRWFLERFILFI
jgi:hypothetical protein